MRRLAGASLRRAIAVVVASVLVVAVPLVSWETAEAQRVASLPIGDHPGARVLMPGGSELDVEADEIIPIGSALESEWVTLEGECTEDRRPTVSLLAETCRERTAEWRSNATVFVIGDSHAQQWAGALTPIAEQEDWTVVALLKGGCSFAPEEPVLGSAEECEQWRDAALEFALSQQPDLVFVMGTKTAAESDDERVLRGLDEYIDPLVDNGAGVVLLRDNPRFSEDMFACIELRGSEAPECRRNAGDVLAASNPAAREERNGVAVTDLTPFLCPDGLCLPVIGGVAVYIDHGHIGQTYAESMAPALREQIEGFLSRQGL